MKSVTKTYNNCAKKHATTVMPNTVPKTESGLKTAKWTKAEMTTVVH